MYELIVISGFLSSIAGLTMALTKIAPRSREPGISHAPTPASNYAGVHGIGLAETYSGYCR